MDLQTLIDRAEITDLLARYARAVDRRDWDLYRSVFTADAHIDYTQVGGIAGTVDKVVGFLSQVMGMFESIQHMISNIEITIDADEADVTAVVYNPLKLPDSPVWATGGWYHHKLVRTPDGWRSKSLVEEAGWFHGIPAPDKPAADEAAADTATPDAAMPHTDRHEAGAGKTHTDKPDASNPETAGTAPDKPQADTARPTTDRADTANAHATKPDTANAETGDSSGHG